ncbi:MAG: hypothetical protein HOH43_08830 [Candidatus Latescibacteria bacterium]|jgi:coenzyme F420 hydrogenase subunit beta|nr:hypothetical protein [Candidatus Latescibacterota bacterium]
MMSERIPEDRNLDSAAPDLSDVITNGMCVACGACEAVDPQINLHLDTEKQMYLPDNAGTSEAASVCPAIHVEYPELHRLLFPQANVTEHGVVESVFLAQSSDKQRNLRASSGGIIKELMRAYLAEPEVDGVICLGPGNGLEFEPIIVRALDQIDDLPGSIYHNVPLGGSLRLLRENEGRFVLTAIPCQLEGIYTYIFKHAPELRQRIHATIGLVCGWNYSHHALRAICEYKGIDYEAIEDISYRGNGPVGKLRITAHGKTTEIDRRLDLSYQVAFDRTFNIPRCHLCVNHTNFLADVVVGDAWLPSTVRTRTGVSLVICRTSESEKLLEELVEKSVATLVTGGLDDITESQGRSLTFGDFSYGYADYLEEKGQFTPKMRGPNREAAQIASQSAIAKIALAFRHKQNMQSQRRYRAIWWRKLTIELGSLLYRYASWFFTRILKARSLTGQRKEISAKRMAVFK